MATDKVATSNFTTTVDGEEVFVHVGDVLPVPAAKKRTTSTPKTTAKRTTKK